MLTILQTTRTLRFTKSGRLLPWLGPALRGLIAGRFKQRVCRQSPADQDGAWRYCTQHDVQRRRCPHMAGCPYGLTVEADPVTSGGHEEPPRPLVLAPEFPAPLRAEPGRRLDLAATFVGGAAAAQAEAFWSAAADAGREPGLGMEGITFEVLPGPDRRELVALPLAPAAVVGAVSRLQVRLTAPLFLWTRGGGPGPRKGDRRLVLRPALVDLWEASYRIIKRLFDLYDGPLPADHHALAEAAQAVRCIEAAFVPFEQTQTSRRGGSSRPLRGIAGGAVYAEVPLALVPWLEWGGRLHVGTERVSGAGAWELSWTG